MLWGIVKYTGTRRILLSLILLVLMDTVAHHDIGFRCLSWAPLIPHYCYFYINLRMKTASLFAELRANETLLSYEGQARSAEATLSRYADP
jgi:hypothetical protein